jgi:hypothetical protein
MISAELKSRIAERPFKPLRLIMDNGWEHDINAPGDVLVGTDCLAVAAIRNGERVIRLVSLAHASKIEDISALP